MQEHQINQNFSNIQMELLKLYSTDVQERELYDIKDFLAQYFAQKAIEKADMLWDKQGLDNDTMDRWLANES